MDKQWSDLLWIVGWLAGFAIIIGILVLAGNLFLAWLAKNPQMARVFTAAFSGFALAVVFGIGAFIVTFFGYGFHRSRSILGVDVVPFTTVASSIWGFLVGSGVGWFVGKRFIKRKDGHAS